MFPLSDNVNVYAAYIYTKYANLDRNNRTWE